MARVVTVTESAGVPESLRVDSGLNAAGQPVFEQWRFSTSEHAAQQRAQFSADFSKAQRDKLAALARVDA